MMQRQNGKARRIQVRIKNNKLTHHVERPNKHPRKHKYSLNIEQQQTLSRCHRATSLKA